MPAIDVRRLRHNPDVEEAPLQGEMMLFDAKSSKFFVLNPTMVVAWRACDGQHTLEDIVEEMGAKFSEVDQKQAGQDLLLAIEELRGLGLLLDSA